MSPKHPKPPRIPTWVLFAGVAGVLTASAVLFVASRTETEQPKPKPRASTNSGSSSSLVLPKGDGDAPSKSGGRTEIGKGRDDDATSTTGTDSTADAAVDAAATDDPQLATLRGARITLAPADGTILGSVKPTGIQRIGTQRVRCGATSVAAALTRERQLLDALERALTAAGANVVRLDDGTGAMPCAVQRSASFEKSDLGLMIAAGASASMVSVGIPGGTLAAADTARAQLYVQSLDQATGAPAQLKPTGAAATNLTAHGVVEMPRGGTVAWLGLDAAADQLGPERLAGSIAAAMATTLD